MARAAMLQYGLRRIWSAMPIRSSAAPAKGCSRSALSVIRADGPSRFDCSGLVYYAFQRAGFEHVPRTSSAQARHMNRIDRSDMRPGDFVFFYDGAATAENVYHVGIFSGWDDGHRMVIHSPSSGRKVGTEAVWDDNWFAGTLRGLG